MQLVSFVAPPEYRFSLQPVDIDQAIVFNNTMRIPVLLERKATMKIQTTWQSDGTQSVGYFPIPNANFTELPGGSASEAVAGVLKTSAGEWRFHIVTYSAFHAFSGRFVTAMAAEMAKKSRDYYSAATTDFFQNSFYVPEDKKNAVFWETDMELSFTTVEGLMQNADDFSIVIDGVTVGTIANRALTGAIRDVANAYLHNSREQFQASMNNQDQAEQTKVFLGGLLGDFATMAKSYESQRNYEAAIAFYQKANLKDEAERLALPYKLQNSVAVFHDSNEIGTTFKGLNNPGLLKVGAFYYLDGINLVQSLTSTLSICVSINYDDTRSHPFIVDVEHASASIFEFDTDIAGLTKGAHFIGRYDGFVNGNPQFTAIISPDDIP
jgi:hypothetical protein